MNLALKVRPLHSGSTGKIILHINKQGLTAKTLVLQGNNWGNYETPLPFSARHAQYYELFPLIQKTLAKRLGARRTKKLIEDWKYAD